MQVVEWRK